jgi:cysteine desulfurase/selenocysteine lyase
MIPTRRDMLRIACAASLIPTDVVRRMPIDQGSGVGLADLRALFPQLATRSNGMPLIYLDSAGTTLRPNPVLETIMQFYQHRNANPGRGIHSLANHAMEEYEDARARIAKFINAAQSLEIIWTKGTTEALNLFASSWAVPRLRSGDEMILTIAEHASCMLPLQIAAKKTGAQIHYIDVDEDGGLRLDQLDKALSSRTRLVAFTHVSNVLGAINPAKEICRRAKQFGARVLIDLAQSVPHFSVDVQDMGCDFAAFSSHKMLGPMGAGALYARRDAMEEISVYQAGANMAHAHGLADWEYAAGALRFGAGTPSVADALGFASAARLLTSLDRDTLWRREQQLTKYALERLHSVPRLRILGPKTAENRVSIFSFVMTGIPTARIVSALDEAGISIRAGDLACRQLLEKFNVQSAARASMYVYTTEPEVENLATALENLVKGVTS